MITRIGANTDGAASHLLGDFINPVFAYSLNRKLRNLYTGEYFRFKDKNGEGDYPSNTPDMSEDVELLKIYDQKEKFGYDKEDAHAGGEIDPDFELPSGPNNGHHRDFNYVGTDLVRPKIIALKSNSGKNITEGNIYEVSLIRFQGGGFICRIKTDDDGLRFVGNRGVEYEVFSPRPPKLKYEDGLYKAVFSGSEYMSIGSADAIGGHFNIILVGKGDYPRPAFGMWGENDTVTIEPSTEAVPKFTVNKNRGAMRSPQLKHVANPDIELPTEPNNGNDYVFPAGERPLVMSLKTDSGKRTVAGDIYRLRRFRVSTINGQIENLDGTDPRYIGIRGAAWETVTEKNPFSPYSHSCFYGFDPAQQDRIMSFNSDGHNVEADTTESFSYIAIGRMRERYYIGEVLELVGYIGDLKLKWHDTLHSQIQAVYQTYK